MRGDPRLTSSLVLPRPVEWAYILLGLALVVRYRWLMDDAFVYFRYIDNLVFLKIGLVYNAGEYVEGYSSPLWLLALLAPRALGLGVSTIVLAAGVLSFCLFAYGLVLLNRRLSPPDAAVVNLPLALLACNYSVASFFTGGLETGLLQLLAPAYGLFLVFPRSRTLQTVVALSPLVRHELVLPLVVVLVAVRRSPGVARRVSTISATTLGAWLLFRVYYYADLLPNTFYLKDDWMILRGLAYLHHTLSTYHLYAVAAILAVLAFALWRRGAPTAGPRWTMLGMALPVLLYVIKVGGASVQYWYLAFPFCLTIASASGLAESATRHFVGSRIGRWAPLLGLAAVSASLTLYPPQLDRHPLLDGARARPLGGINDPQWHRDLLRDWRTDWRAATSPSRQTDWRREMDRFAYSGVLRSGVCLAVYERFHVRAVHIFGLTEPILARVNAVAHKPGHKRDLWVLAHDLARLRRDAGPGRLTGVIAAASLPSWMAENIATVETIERKMFNRHHLGENLLLALAPVRRIELDAATLARSDEWLGDRSPRRPRRRRRR